MLNFKIYPLVSSILILWFGFCSSAVTRDTVNTSSNHFHPIRGANLTAHSAPQYYDYDNRDARQWLSGYGGGYGGGGYGYPSLGGGHGIDSLLIGLLVVLGIGVIGFPFLILIFSLFTGGANNLNFIPPTTTTTVAGRKKREIESMFANLNPVLSEQMFRIFENFTKSKDKIQFIQKYLDKKLT